MEAVEIPRSVVDKVSSLETALQAYNKDEFFQIKREFLQVSLLSEEGQRVIWKSYGELLDEKQQEKIWEDYRELLLKAVSKILEAGDIERLDSYRQLESSAWGVLKPYSYLFPEKVIFPVAITRNEHGQIVWVNLESIDNEITKRWFQHIYDVLVGRVDVRVCQAPKCEKLFIRKGRKDKKFCSHACQQRAWSYQKRGMVTPK